MALNPYGTDGGNTQINETEAAIAITREATKAQELEPGSIYLTTLYDGSQEVIDTDRYLTVPRGYPTFNRILDAPDDFIEFLKARDEGHTEIWAHLSDDRTAITVNAWLDADGHRRRQVGLRFATTQRWRDWQAIDGKLYEQAPFAEFIESYAGDIQQPDAATMLEVAQSLRASTATVFESSQKLSNGETRFVYKEDLEGKAGKAGDLSIPDQISIAVQPFTSSGAFKIDAKFRYRIVNRELRLGVKFLNADRMVERVFDETVEALREADVAPVYLGS